MSILLNENYIFSEDDIIVNFEKWQRKSGYNVLIITGISGGGKTTLAYDLGYEYQAEVFQMDWIEHFKFLNVPNEEGVYNHGMTEFIKKHNKTFLSDTNKFGKEYSYLYVKNGLWDCFNSGLEYAKRHPNNLFIFEGIQFPGYFNDYPAIKFFPIIIKGTSVLKSMYRRYFRDSFKGMNKNILSWYNDVEKRNKKFKDNVTSEKDQISFHYRDEAIKDSFEIASSLTLKEQGYIAYSKKFKNGFYYYDRIVYASSILINGIATGFIHGFENTVDKNKINICLAVKEEYRRKKLGSILIEEMFRYVPKEFNDKIIVYGVDDDNEASKALRKSVGFPDKNSYKLNHKNKYVYQMTAKEIKDRLIERRFKEKLYIKPY